MSDFRASIIAELDTSKIPSEISKIENQQIVFSNFSLNTKDLGKKIQAALDGYNFTLNLTNVKINNLNNSLIAQAKNAGNQAAQAINNTISNINVSNPSRQIAEMQQTLRAMNFNTSDIDILTEHLNNFDLKIEEVRTHLEDDGLSITVKGTDGFGRTITLLERYDSASGKIVRVNEDIAQSFAKMERAAEKNNQTILKSQTLSNKMTAWLNNNKDAARLYGNPIEKLQESLQNNNDPKVLQDIALQFQGIQTAAKAAGLTVNSFSYSLKNTVKQLLGLTSAVAVIQTAVRVMKEMYHSLYEIDTAMTNLYKVTDETNTKYNSFLDRSKKNAIELGKTVSSLVEQTATWAKLGYGLDDAAELAKISSIYANVGEVDDATAVSDLVTAMKAFNIEASDSMVIVDALNELGNKFATDAASLGSGLTKAASTLQLAGASLNETLAMITGGSEITQNATEFSNALKVMALRVRGMKGELEELGEEVDENVDSISKVQTQILNLTKGEVNIFDDNGDFRNFYKIMEDISKVFDKLQSTDQANLTEILFGKVRANQGTALIRAFQSGQVNKALETANASAGSAAAEQAKWLESLEAKTNSFKAAWEGLSESFLKSNFLKTGIDLGTKALEILTWIVDHMGSLPALIAAAGTAISVFKKDLGREKRYPSEM